MTMIYVEAIFLIGAFGVTAWTLFGGRPTGPIAKKLLSPIPTTWRSFESQIVQPHRADDLASEQEHWRGDDRE